MLKVGSSTNAVFTSLAIVLIAFAFCRVQKKFLAPKRGVFTEMKTRRARRFKRRFWQPIRTKDASVEAPIRPRALTRSSACCNGYAAAKRRRQRGRGPQSINNVKTRRAMISSASPSTTTVLATQSAVSNGGMCRGGSGPTCRGSASARNRHLPG
jgi:hypothetical protein